MITEGIIIAIVAACGGVMVALLNRTRQHSKAIRDQVENDHSTNLRVEADDRHAELVHRIEGIASDVRGIRRDLGRHADHLGRHEERLDYLERTQPPPKKRR